MKKLTVQTTGNFMLLDQLSGVEIMPGSPHTVPHTTFIDERITAGQLVVTEGDYEALEPEPNETQIVTPPVIGVVEIDNDANDDGHDDKTGEFTEGNQEAAKPAKSGRGRGRRGN